jgi:hypothetical protein
VCHTAGQRQSRQPVLFGIAVDEGCKSWFLVAAVKPWRRRGLLLYPLDCSGSFIRGHGAAGRSWTNRHLPIGISQKFNALESYEKYSCGQVPANRVAFCSSLLQKRRNLRLSVQGKMRAVWMKGTGDEVKKCINLLFSCHSPGASQAQPAAIIVWSTNKSSQPYVDVVARVLNISDQLK